MPASKVAYEISVGEVPAGMVVRHTCDRPSCCNPAHLVLGSELDNYNDREKRGRFMRRRGRFASTVYEQVSA